ncbi:MAG: hypothetical protein COZ21_06695 [Bacteroidetes bacterium CG_4_10_14_3_um_filter_31_20]|nr:MAG: hypothetical protein COZ59_09645 [Bacteroidetes bacterium CG_4_8_14_3_um_filter_31_14]PIY04422.1 MAG: hypothetical protein COZ21_06695 [Bacteroidetes bacterium CG_4_10_14_3_um_filter_31_20]
MKKYILIALLFSLNFITFAQSKVVKLFPQYGQGYLALYRNADLGIAYWTVEIALRTWYNDSVYNDKIVDKFTLTNLDYMKMPEEYLDSNKNFIFTVQGFNTYKVQVVNDGPWNLGGIIKVCPGCGPMTIKCSKKCNGTTYAWAINQYVNDDNSQSSFELSSTLQIWDPVTYTGIPYYEYMNQSEFNQVSQGSQVPYWELYYNNFYGWTPGNSPHVISIPNTYPQHVYLDAMGNPLISGAIYGVQKDLGNWNGDYIESQIEPFGSICYNPTQYFIDFMNDYVHVNQYYSFDYTLMPELVCQPSPGGGTPPHPIPGVNIPSLIYCAHSVVEATDLSDVVGTIDSCLNSPAQQLLGGFWPDYILGISIGRLDKEMTPITLLAKDLFGPNGEYLNPNFTLEPGLYSLGLVLSDGTYVPIYKAFKKEISFSRNYSEFLNATISPVPINGEEFNLHIEANATLKFDYVLFDFNGNELYRKNFVIHQYQLRDYTVKPKVNMPSGMLLNKFIFEDGSQLNIQTIKN